MAGITADVLISQGILTAVEMAYSAFIFSRDILVSVTTLLFMDVFPSGL